MKINEAMEIMEELKGIEPNWRVTVEAGYSYQSYLLVETDHKVEICIRSARSDMVSLSGVYGGLSKYIQEGDTLPREEIALADAQNVAHLCQAFEGQVSQYLAVLTTRQLGTAEGFDSRKKIADRLAATGVKIAGAVDIWKKTKKYEISGEITRNGTVVLNVVCDPDTAERILLALRKE